MKELVKVKRIFRQLILVKAHATFEKAFLMDESAQVDNFILPDHKSTHLLTFSLSPFVELPLPSDAILSEIEEELKYNDDLSKSVFKHSEKISDFFFVAQIFREIDFRDFRNPKAAIF